MHAMSTWNSISFLTESCAQRKYSMKDREDFLREQARLYKTLLENYNQRLPPVTTIGNKSERIDLPRFEVTVTLLFLKLIRMVETEAKVDFLFDYQMSWIDERLKWSPDDYCGITHLYVGFEDIWIPEVSIVEAHSSQDFREDYQKHVWVQDFPFDEQHCAVKLMPQSFSPQEYGIQTKLGPDLTTALDSLSSYMFLMKRNPSFYLSMIIAPSFVINVLSILGVFLKAADSMGKLGMALTNIMSLTFVLGILATTLPKTEQLPRIGIYVVVNLSIMVAALIIVLTLPHVTRRIFSRIGMADDFKGEISKKKQEKPYMTLNFVAFVLLELANLINFLILVI
ncbi:unnamed protein product [Haemonchus placei]|uniref:Neur_chan_LBD domain-containing protein n=1 Tax=Haemonchus placei TaxID=6290 RepID=A0A158QR92_HAEPC|nr:unnamed protein product [Haemonchus placei]